MDNESVSNAFLTFLKETPEYSQPWMEAVQKLDHANPLDGKTKALAYLAVLAALRLVGGIPFHVKHAKSLGASREEVIGAVLVGLPAAGHGIVQALPIALDAFGD